MEKQRRVRTAEVLRYFDILLYSGKFENVIAKIATFTPESKCGLTTRVNSLFFLPLWVPTSLLHTLHFPACIILQVLLVHGDSILNSFSPPSFPLFTSVHQNIYGSYHPPFLPSPRSVSIKTSAKGCQTGHFMLFLMFACSAVRATPFWVALGFGSN